MAIKKTDLYSSLWASCDELRGGMDASQYKNYILTLLFVKYVSDKYAGKKHGAIVVPEGGSFADMVAQKGKADIGDQLNKIIGKLATENDMAWLSNPENDFNNEDRLGKGKAMVDTLSSLVGIFENLSLGKNRADGDDLLGDAYEFLMRHFATESGKSKGQFYTPSEVSRILASVLGIDKDTRQDETAYDPTCGSGSLLLKVNDQAPNGLTLYGQEKDNATAALAKMNMILHDCPSADIWQDDTLAEPHWLQDDGNLKTFDYAVANPPFSSKSWSSGITISQDQFNRFEYGEPPEKNGDYAFLLHIIKSLNSAGKGAVILPHGVLFRGNAEADIRRNIIRQGYIQGIIGLPANLFYGTGIPACIIVIDKAGAKAERPIFMIDASKGFMKDGNKNRLRSQDIHKIIDVFNKGLVIDRYSRLVPYDEIVGKNEFNLNIPRYIDSSEPEDIHDLDAHLNGGIPNPDIDALQEYWDVFPTLRSTLFEEGTREGYSEPLVEEREVKATILCHNEFESFKAGCLELLEGWKDAHQDRLMSIDVGTSPKELIFDISEDLLTRFGDARLLSKYNVYQILMDYWAEIMQDDVYMLSQDGWKAANVVRQLVPVKDKKGKSVYKEDHDFEFGSAKIKKRYRSDIVRPKLIIDRYFSEQQAALNDLEAAQDEATQTLEAFIEDNSGEDGLIEDAKNDKGKVTQKGIKDRLKESTDDEEIAALKECIELVTAESKAKSEAKAAKEALDDLVFKKIPTIPEDGLKDIVVNEKWYARVEEHVVEEIERVTQSLANRVKTLEQRYSKTLPSLSDDVSKYTDRVEAHLKKMGLSW
ncbi:type I restriction endonuclease subunit M [Marinobacter maroccanus]|uniref:site-specific DNA-methyltransferase (adenine-specific) n=1 Tax=Marinobacter maroccanus TaxID=2055143 RepID=A0A2S5ZD95_9GAMM|nr:class I SAM-dependent DNA methyltransferase [Marinobacter maroccanus]PPI85357.1 type I restriction endonuclease subunit M [Marinobacter maroccanus]